MGGPSAWEWMFYLGLPALLQAITVSVILSFVIWFVLKKMDTQMGSSGLEDENAMEIVRRRYAKGEIPRREYEQLREDLETGDTGSVVQKEKERAR